MQSIAFVSEKGGVGKTTTVLNLAAGLAARGKRVLVVDTDPQANSTFVLLKGEKPRRPALSEVLVAEAQAHEVIVPAPAFGGVDLLPADATLADATVALANEVGRERRLRLAMEGVDGSYDFVLVDTAPTRSIITTNVLNYVRDLFVPMAPVLFGVLGLGQLQADVGQVRRFLDNRALHIGGIVLTMVERNNVVRGIEDQLREIFGPVVFEARIPRSLKLEEAHARHESIFTYAPKSPGAAAYKALTEEVLNHASGEEDGDRDPERNPSAHSAA